MCSQIDAKDLRLSWPFNSKHYLAADYVAEELHSTTANRFTIPMPKIAQKILAKLSSQKSQIAGYTIEMDEFGVKNDAPTTIYQRNFGFLFKADGAGLKYYLNLEEGQGPYTWDQPGKFG